MTKSAALLPNVQLYQLRLSRGATKLLLNGIPTDQFLLQPAPGAHHAMWTVGHLAATDDYFVKKFGGGASTLPASWESLFGMGSKPMPEASKYPSADEVLKALDERRATFEKWVEGLSPEQLAQPTPEGWEAYAPTLGDLPFFAAWHEGYHAGQLAPVRRALGLASAFG